MAKTKETKDKRKAECPYCHKSLIKIPAKKTKCPHCGEFMLIRTDPKGNVRVLVTKQEAGKIDTNWLIVTGRFDDFIAKRERFKKVKEMLRKNFGREPSENDIKWRICNENLIEHSQNFNWGLYRNTRFEMAEILRKATRLMDALETYLEVCYLDLNGPRNVGGIRNLELLKEFPTFDPEHFSSLAPRVIYLIKQIIKKLEFDKEKVKIIFIEHNSQIENSLRLPLIAKDCWLPLEKEIWN